MKRLSLSLRLVIVIIFAAAAAAAAIGANAAGYRPLDSVQEYLGIAPPAPIAAPAKAENAAATAAPMLPAPTTLAPGDIAPLGVNSATTDKFSLILLKPIGAGTVINFTDNGFATATSGGTTEGFLTLYRSKRYACGNDTLMDVSDDNPRNRLEFGYTGELQFQPVRRPTICIPGVDRKLGHANGNYSALWDQLRRRTRDKWNNNFK